MDLLGALGSEADHILNEISRGLRARCGRSDAAPQEFHQRVRHIVSFTVAKAVSQQLLSASALSEEAFDASIAAAYEAALADDSLPPSDSPGGPPTPPAAGHGVAAEGQPPRF
eukprot:TRINITY_DN2897_c0_g1_i10.p2 TRINITY_DN2897_c0_g1~~TRINITY_DN2897_c0_g1_i10.p2  ORF type:complete len:113 (+),score=22.97 TRINITY_DN2897_c0_g1_i10:1097-1435(+)